MMKKLTIFFVLLLSLGEAWGQGVKPKLKLQIGHTDSVKEILLLPDGKSFLTRTSFNNTIKHWDLASGKELQTFRGHTDKIEEIILLPDAKTFLTRAEDDHTVKYRDIASGKELQTFEGHTRYIYEILLLPDAKTFLTGSTDGTVKHWNLKSGKELQTFEGHKDPMYEILLLPDAKTFLTGSTDGTVKHWNLKSGKELQTFEGHKDPIYEILLLPNGKTFLTRSPNEVIHWDLKSGKKLQNFKEHIWRITKILSLPNGKTFLTGGFDGTIKHWDLKSGKLLQTFKGHINGIEEIILLPNGKTFLTRDFKDKTVKYWNLKSGKLLQTFKGHTKNICEILLLPNSRTFLTRTRHGNTIKHWDIASGKEINTFKHTGRIEEIILLPNSKTFLTGSWDYTVKHWDLKSGKELQNFKGHTDHIRKIFLSPSGKTFLIRTTYPNKTLKHWDWVSGKELQTFKRYTDHIREVIPLPDGKTFLTYCDGENEDFTIKHWDLESGKEIKTFKGHTGEIREFLLLPNGKTFLTKGGGEVIHWELASGKELHTFKNSWNPILLPNNKTFLTYNRYSEKNFIIEHWDLASDEKLHTFKGHTDQIKEIILLANGKTFLTYCDGIGFGNKRDFTIKYWDIASGKELHTFKGHNTNKIQELLLLPDGKTFLTRAENDYTVKHWDIASGKELHTFKGHTPYKGFSAIERTHIEEILLLPNGKTFLTYCGGGSSNEDFTVKHWDLASGKEINTFEGHKGEIWQLLLLSNSKTFLTRAYLDNTIKHWDLASGKEINTFEGHKGSIYEILLLTNDKTFLTTSSDNTVKHWDLKTGKCLGTFSSSYGYAESIHFLKDSTKFLTVNEQNSITLWDFKNYQEICTLIPKAGNNKDFILTTPDNYYFATKGAVNDLVHYVVGTQVYLFSQFDLQYNRPDIVLERIGLASDTLIQTYRLAYQKRLEKMDFSEERIKIFMNGEFEKDFNAPEIELLGKGNFVFEETTQSEYTFSFTAIDAKYNIERIFVNVDGVPLYGAKGIILKNPNQNLQETTIKVPLIAGENIITLSVINAQGVASLEKRLEITYNPPQPTKPTLYVFSIGVNEYQDKDITKLDYAVKDAEKVVEIFAQNKGDFVAVKNFTLTDAEVNKENILALRKELLKTNTEDMVIFNFAGHGFLDDSTNYYLGTYDTDLNNLSQTGLKYDAVESLLDGIPARKKLMFIDACHSGEVDKESVSGKFKEKKRPTKRIKRSDGTTYEVNVLSQTAFEVMKASFSDLRIGTGTTVISASGGLEAATEDYTWGHGAFTYTLIQGLQKKKADLDKNGKITVSELQTYLAEEVQRLTDGFQKPTSRIENIVNDFVIWE